jgi:signal transduction histidine kinase
VEALRLALRRERARHREALEQQTATAEILRVISSSPTALRPVLDAILEKATHLCDAHLGVLNLFEGDNCRTVAQRGGSPEFAEWVLARGAFKPAAAMARVLADRRPFHVADARQGPGYRARHANAMKFVDLGGVRTYLAVPLLKEGTVIGSINIFRPEVRPFTDKQIALVSTFANQAVIAIENTRLLNETKEALERQTATAEILRVISSTPTDVQPVFDAIVKSCFGLFKVGRVSLWIVDNGRVELRAREAAPGERAGSYRHTPLNRESGVGRCILDGRLLHVPDMLEVLDELPLARQLTLSVDYRSAVFTPLMRGDAALGAISLLRRAPGPFSDKEIALLQTFANQAVIAIENVRLFNELQSSNGTLREALEQQTATSDILKVISRSPTDVQPVFDTIVRNALRLSHAVVAWLFRYDGTMIDVAADSGVAEQLRTMYRTAFPQPPSKDNPVAEAILARRVVHVPDIFASGYSSGPKDRARVTGYRSILAVPMMRENAPIGAIVLAAPGTFSDTHVALLQMFADQAVIAIENVRLFNELQSSNSTLRDALEQQTATSEILKVISSTQIDVQPIFDTIIRNGVRLGSADLGTFIEMENGELQIRASYNVRPEADVLFRSGFPQRLTRDSSYGRAISDGAVVNITDYEADPPSALALERARTLGIRSALAVPLMRKGEAVGAIAIGRQDPGGFPEAFVSLLKTFADQAVIAIENARLFREIQEKSFQLEVANRQLEVANKHKSDFLANMSHELRTPLNAIIGFSEVMIEQMFGELNEKQLEYQKDIHASGKHLLSLINDILDLSKIEAGRMELELSQFDLPTAVSNAVTLIRERAQRHGIALGVEVDPRLGDFQADERKVKQILLNLLSNAVKFTPDGGRVDVSAKLDTDKVEIAVKDTGVGIAPADQASLFEEFKQFGNDRSRKAEGTGLGLALTRRLVELHGGQILVDSAVGQGSTFRVLLPVRH